MYLTKILDVNLVRGFKLLGIVFIMSMIFNSCAFDMSSGDDSSLNKEGKEFTSTYICPMHCDGSGSEEPGTCPVCGMDYVENSEQTDHDHDHDHDH